MKFLCWFLADLQLFGVYLPIFFRGLLFLARHTIEQTKKNLLKNQIKSVLHLMTDWG